MNPTDDYAAIRKEYEEAGISHDQLPNDPMELFRQWYQNAVEHQPADWSEPNAMALATSDSAGNVSNRIVLLKGITDVGVQFFTHYDSQKGTQIAANPKAAATFHWAYLGRQVRVVGAVEKTSREVSEEYFHSRPRGAQLSAAVSPQSSPIPSRAELQQQAKLLNEQLNGQPVPLPERWGGFLIIATRIEFWQGRPDRCHDRAVYLKQEDGQWDRLRIAP
ncbi:MAG: pyridoxamine 5'-phosphate oxidase [Planctomycetota bacterium]